MEISALLAVRLFLTLKSSADDAVKANDAVPNSGPTNEPVNEEPVTFPCTLRLEFITNPDVLVASKVVVADVDNSLNLLADVDCNSNTAVELPPAFKTAGVEETVVDTVRPLALFINVSPASRLVPDTSNL